jgi:hypothetical protein
MEVYISKKEAILYSRRIWKECAETGLQKFYTVAAKEYQEKFEGGSWCPLCDYTEQFVAQGMCFSCPFYTQLKLTCFLDGIGYWHWNGLPLESNERKAAAKAIYDATMKLRW